MESSQQGPQAPTLKANSYAIVGQSKIPCLESYDELKEKVEGADPGSFVEITVAVTQPEAEGVVTHPLFQLVGINMREGFTRASYRENLFGGYIEVMPPPAE